MEKIKCQLCNSDDTEIVFQGRDAVEGQKVSHTICKNCGLVYLNPQPTAKEYIAYYQKTYIKERRKVYELKEAIERLEGKKSYQVKEKYLNFIGSHLSQNSEILDIGCGWGTLLKVIKDKVGCEVEGIEPSSLCAELANKYYKLKVFAGSFDEYFKRYAQNKKFDFIILHHVFEHFSNPIESLRAIKKLLKESGYLYLALPNVSSPGEANEEIFRFPHPYNFSPHTVFLSLLRAGFKIVKFEEFPIDMKLISTQIENHESALPFSLFRKGQNYKDVVKAINRNQLKYSFFRKMKKLIPVFKKGKPRDLAIKALKKLNIIKI